MSPAGPAQWGALAALVLLVPAQLMAVWRIFRGPRAADRVVAADLFSVLAVGSIAGLTVLDGQFLLLTSALVIALLAFLGTVAFAYYLAQKRSR